MPTLAATLPHFDHDAEKHEGLVSHRVTRYLVPVGRVLFALIFLLAGPNHFRSQTIAYAASQGVPLASLLVPASGVLALVGGLCIAFGLYARLGAFLIALFLIPVTLMMHRFWGLPDQQMAMMQMAMFMKNVAMLGCALVLTHFGAGPFSLDARAHAPKSEAPREREPTATR